LEKFIYFSTIAGSTFSNPVDTPLATLEPEKFYQILNIMANSTDIDILVGYLGVDVSEPEVDIKNVLITMANTIINSAKTHSKATMIVADSTITETLNDTITSIRKNAQVSGLLAYPSIDRAASAISKIIEHHRQIRR